MESVSEVEVESLKLLGNKKTLKSPIKVKNWFFFFGTLRPKLLSNCSTYRTAALSTGTIHGVHYELCSEQIEKKRTATRVEERDPVPSSLR